MQDILRGILREPGGIIIRRDQRKIILKRNADGDLAFPLFIKIYQEGGIFRSLRETLSGSAGERELRISRKLAADGVPVPEPIGSATERSAAGLVTRSLFAARWMEDMTSLSDYARRLNQTGRADDAVMDALCRSLGAFVAGLHDHGVLTRDMNTGNFLVRRSDAGAFNILLVDFEGVDIVRTVPRKRRIANLTQIAAFLLPLERNAAERICAAYAAAGGSFLALPRLTREVHARSLRLSELWKQKLDERFGKIQEMRRGSGK